MEEHTLWRDTGRYTQGEGRGREGQRLNAEKRASEFQLELSMSQEQVSKLAVERDSTQAKENAMRETLEKQLQAAKEDSEHQLRVTLDSVNEQLKLAKEENEKIAADKWELANRLNVATTERNDARVRCLQLSKENEKLLCFCVDASSKHSCLLEFEQRNKNLGLPHNS
ncbi:hypothetical protein Pelo_8264 [Pelomyxa schiedti]|nr:hypothetical protein Pelo_8264 [Pelomyxa schiedti]